MDNANFKRHQKNVFKTVERETEQVEQIPEIFGETYGKNMIEHLKCHGWKK